MKETITARVQDNWGYTQVSLEATAEHLKGKDVTIGSYRVGKVIDARVSDGVDVVIEIKTP